MTRRPAGNGSLRSSRADAGSRENELDLPSLWDAPPAFGHNGGPPLDDARPPGRPTILTPELEERLLDLLADGVPIRVICRTPGMPSRTTFYSWRLRFPGFDRAVEFAVQMGIDHLVHLVVEEVERNLERAGPKWASYVFNLRKEKLARMNPKVFGCRDQRC